MSSSRKPFGRPEVLQFWLLLFTLGAASLVRASGDQGFLFQELPPPPVTTAGAFVGINGQDLVVAGGIDDRGKIYDGIYRLSPGSESWKPAGRLPRARTHGSTVSLPNGAILLGGITETGPTAEVTLLTLRRGQLELTELPDLPAPVSHSSATAVGRTVFVAGGRTDRENVEATLRIWSLDVSSRQPVWEELDVPPGSAGNRPLLLGLQETLFIFGGTRGGERVENVWSYHRVNGWRELSPAPEAVVTGAAAPFGHAHVFFFSSPDEPGGASAITAYHTVTDRWVDYGQIPGAPLSAVHAVTHGDTIHLVDADRSLQVEVLPLTARFGFIDQAAVMLYLGGMILMGFYFVHRERSTRDYFRAGNRIPWWAAGMSLFATGASAISLMSMPGRAYYYDWTYFGISIYAVLALPIALYLLAPLIRRLAITTPGDYLERRFGLGARMLAASIYSFTQVGARMGSVMLLPSIAMSAITGIPVTTCIIVMGLVTTIYTFLGGLEAVIWTDTVQGFVMVLSVIGCLALVFTRLDVGIGESYEVVQAADKLRLFDLRWDLTYPTAYLLFITTVLGTLGGIGDQNFIQRVQCTPDLKQTRMAVATQLGVAVPINVLLFSLGTALFLFYRERPELLNPTMQTDSIFPFFVAQQLPAGISGLVVAALLAATMSTISSSICGVANIGVEDFARRFRPQMTDRNALVLGRVLTALIGLTGMGTALYLSQTSMPSVWDLAQMITNLISNGIVGLFGLGLLTRRAHQLGAMLGVACGMIAVFYFQNYTGVSFWAFSFIGSVVTFTTGYFFSLMLPGKPRGLQFLTVYSLPQAEQPPPHSTAEKSRPPNT